MFAIVETGGKQVRAAVGESVEVEKLGIDEGGDVSFDKILLVSGEDGTKVGAPYVDGAVVKGQVVSNHRGPKITVFKMKRRKQYRLKQGHRQSLTRVRITAIEG